MTKPRLYLFIGYPGAGKTTVSEIIAENTGAVHLWADRERHKMFKSPSHSSQESLELYDQLNKRAERLLAAGKSVVFDTNFNFFADRQKLRSVAERQGAETIVIWITAPKAVAKARAVDTINRRNGYNTTMTEQQFNDITAKLELPAKDEKIVKIDSQKLDRRTVLALLG